MEKIKANNLAPDMIGGVIEYLEGEPLKNLNWIDSISIDKHNTYTVTIKNKANYYPKIILLYNKITKSKILHGNLYQIEEQLQNLINY